MKSGEHDAVVDIDVLVHQNVPEPTVRASRAASSAGSTWCAPSTRIASALSRAGPIPRTRRCAARRRHNPR